MALPSSCDVLVIGAGPAGSTSAALLQQAGYSAVVVEKQKFPRFVIGESLLPHCMDLLDEAKLLDAVRARNFIVKRGALFLRGDERADFNFAEQFTKGWDHTWQVPRADFDKTLADAVEARGVPIAYEHEVIAADFSGAPKVTIADARGKQQTITSRFVIDASGYGRVLPRLLDLEVPSTLPPRKAVFTHLRGDKRDGGPEQNRIWIVTVAPGGWVWIIPFSDGTTSFGIVGGPEVFANLPTDHVECLRTLIASDKNFNRLRETEFIFEPRVIGGYSCSVKQLHGPGYCLVGNATEFLDPVFSSGVTLALESANRASNTLIRQLRGEAVDWAVDYASYMARGIDVFRTFVMAWYEGTLPKIIFQPRSSDSIRRMICSVLAGYVWDESNPFVAQHQRKVAQVARLEA